MALAAAWMGLIEAGWAQQVTNTTTGIGYTTLTTAVNGASSGDVLVVDPGTVVDTGTIFVSKDLTIEGAGKGVSILTLSVSAPLTVLQPTAGVSLTLRDLTVQGYGERQSPVNALDGGNTFVAERVAFEGTADFDFALVTLVEPAAASFDGVDFRGTADFDAGALSSAGLGVAGSSVLYAPVDVVDSTFTDLRVSDLASAIVVQFVDLTCTRCTFVRAGVPNANPDLTEISVEGQYSTVGITESRFCDSGAVALYPADGSVTNNLFVRSAGPLLQGVVALSNNTFAAPISPIAAQYSGAVDVRNNLLYATETGSAGVTIDATASAVVEYNWFEAMGVPLIGGGTLSATNRVDGGDPLLVGWPVPADVDCASLALYPTPVASPLLDVGDPALIDPDGTSSDIGAYGGPGAPAVPYHGDADSDGAPFFHDCNEQNAHVWPGAPEVCDGLDDDCDGLADDDDPDVDLSTSTSWVPDCDLDGQGGVGGLPIDGCSPPPFDPCPDGGGWSTGSADCDDDDPVTYDGAPELCLDGDQSCDGDPLADAIDAVELWVDLDGDGFGAGSPSVGCPAVGLVAVGGDCDDSIGSIHPGLPDACGDGVDTDCDGGDGDLTNEVWWYPDLDQDAHGDPSAAPVFDCDLSPGATTVDRADDCDDTRADVHPGAVEVCDGADQDCDGPIDDLPAATWFADADHDGFGDPNRSVFEGCPGPDWAMNREDCDDTDPTRFPDAEEVCDGVDQDCDNAVDDVRGSVVWYRDVDGDGHGDGRTGEGFPCPPGDGWAASSDDCDDADPDRWDVCRPDVAKKPVGSPDTGCGCAGGGPAPGAVGVGLSVIALLRRRTIAARA